MSQVGTKNILLATPMYIGTPFGRRFDIFIRLISLIRVLNLLIFETCPSGQAGNNAYIRFNRGNYST